MPLPAAGYSATPLPRKLGVKPGHRVLLRSAPRGWTVEGLPEGAKVVRSAARADVVVAFFREAAAVEAGVAPLGEVIRPDGSLWLAWPRRGAGHQSDITDNVLRELVLPTGMVDVKVAALDHDWSALKFVWRANLRA